MWGGGLRSNSNCVDAGLLVKGWQQSCRMLLQQNHIHSQSTDVIQSTHVLRDVSTVYVSCCLPESLVCLKQSPCGILTSCQLSARPDRK